MSKFTSVWKRRLRPLLLTAVRQRFVCGLPSPRMGTTASALRARGGCESTCLDHVPRSTLPPHKVTGDLAAVDHIRTLIDNPLAREAYDRQLSGVVVQPETDGFVTALGDSDMRVDPAGLRHVIESLPATRSLRPARAAA